MLIEINHHDGKPAYLQIVDQVKYAAAAGRLRPGDGLPSIRQLAERLRINRNTVDKAYRELDRQRVIETVRGRGAFLSDRGSPDGEELLRTVLSAAVDGVIVKAHHSQLSGEELLALMRERLAAFEEKRQQGQRPARRETDHGNN